MIDFTPPFITPPAIVKYADMYYPHTKIARLWEKYTYIEDSTPPKIAKRKIKRLSNLGNKKVYSVYYVYPDGIKMGIPYLLIRENKDIRHANIEEIGKIHKNNNIVDHTPSYVPEAVIKKLNECAPFVDNSGNIRVIRYRKTWKNYEVYKYYYYLYEPKLLGGGIDVLYDCTKVRFPNKEERWDIGIYPAQAREGDVPTLCKNKLKKTSND